MGARSRARLSAWGRRTRSASTSKLARSCEGYLSRQNVPEVYVATARCTGGTYFEALFSLDEYRGILLYLISMIFALKSFFSNRSFGDKSMGLWPSSALIA